MPTAADLCELIDRLAREDGGASALQTGYSLYEAVVAAKLVEPGPAGQGRVAAWMGELVADGRAVYSSRAPSTSGLPAGVAWTDSDLQSHYGYGLTNGGRADARETRRLRRERDTDLILHCAIGKDVVAGLGVPAGQALGAHLRDLRAALDADDGIRAIGATKELIESAAKIVLEDAGEPVSRGANPGQLYRAALATVGHPEPPAKGFAIARGAAGLVAGITELRNEVGVAHGATSPRVASLPDARLAARVAIAAVNFLFDERVARASH